jgi:predicted branched-subunit amino acid permease
MELAQRGVSMQVTVVIWIVASILVAIVVPNQGRFQDNGNFMLKLLSVALVVIPILLYRLNRRLRLLILTVSLCLAFGMYHLNNLQVIIALSLTTFVLMLIMIFMIEPLYRRAWSIT